MSLFCMFLCCRQYMVAIPATLESGAVTKLCASLLQPNETLVMTITLKSSEENTTLFTQASNKDFHSCTQFMVPLGKNGDVQAFEVEVRGQTYYSKEVRKVLIKVYHPETFVQTDKPIYLPGQTGNLELMIYDVVYNMDAGDNRIGQWLNETSNSKILQLSYDLNSEAREGHYQVIVTIGSDKIHHNFKVEKYVLPKFEIKINASDEVIIDDEGIKAEVCATYTFGQPVPGSVEVKMCRPLNHHYIPRPALNDVTQEEHFDTDNKGCATFIFQMSAFTRVAQKVLRDELQLRVKVEEEGTGKSYNSVTFICGKERELLCNQTIYDQGSNLEGKVTVHYNKTPIADMPLYLFEGESWSSRRLQNLTTNSDGVASFSISTSSSIQRDVHLVSNLPKYGYAGYRTPYFEAGEHSVSLLRPSTPHTKTVSFLEVKKKNNPLPCDKEEVFTIQYTVVGEAQGSVDVMYLVLTRGAIVMQGAKRVQVQESGDETTLYGEVTFKLMVSPDMAPDVQVVAYAVLPSENVMAHSADFSVEKCFGNKVSLEFSPSSAVPGEEAILQVTAQPDSLCGVSAVDQSVLIKEPGKSLDAEKIFDLLPVKKNSHIPYMVQDSVECLRVRPRRYVMPSPNEQKEDNVGMKMATNLLIRVPSCLQYKGRQYHQGINYRLRAVPETASMLTPNRMGSAAGPPDSPIETVRTFFPETWIWDLVEVGESGVKDVSLTVPDTITTWETEAFCLSPHGFGLAPRKEITVFQPFFLELTLPYSIIRGEHFELKATVFNYMSSCIMVTVAPVPSLEYTLTPLSGDHYTSCLCGNQRRTVSWTMAPSALGVVNVTVVAEAVASHVSCDNEVVSVPKRGRIDSVTQSLIVKVGTTRRLSESSASSCLLSTGETLKEEVHIQLPEDVIVGSARASVSVLGDILGRALNNLHGLLRMPYGCGEQNMALLAPNIYILQYLRNTQQLTSAINDKATKFLTGGYQRQLNYRHGDGAYSTFGSGTGNTWLTAFVVRSFTKAQSFVYIDPKTMEGSVAWLKAKQQENGCFQQSGKLFNNRMKGGVSDEVTLSAYITAAFLEMNTSVDVMKRSLSCLRESFGDLSNSYSTALLAYVFTLAGDTEARAHLLEHLDSVAIRQGFLHWAQKASGTSTSLSVEISSYVLLAKLSASPTNEDLGYAAHIVRWLAGQQNYRGGFSSTQDTVVALQALALYSALVFSPGGSSAVTVQTPSGQLMFEVNQNNKLLYQETELHDTTGKFSLEVKGTTCAVMQLPVDWKLGFRLTLVLFCLCLRYSGEENTTNMVILDIKMLSGFVPDPESLKSRRCSPRVDAHGVVCFSQQLLRDTPIFYRLDLIQELRVQNLKPAVVKIYDYYQPGKT
uniref:Alpha-2-macroglobulin-like n=1 Tax=Cyclopterus lumpus TaxID=8103 RepID=A0A8C2YY14_CYCLU